MEPLPRFTALYQALNAGRGFWEDSAALKFASLAALAVPGSPEEAAAALRSAAEALKKESGWFGQLNSSLRFIVSAMLVQSGDDPARFLAEVERVREVFRGRSLRRGGSYEVMAILILRQDAGREPIGEAAIERFQSIYQEMKRHHWWLTGPEDFPACALLARDPGTPEALAVGVERVFEALRGEGFSAGDPLQTAASILYLSGLDPHRAAQRFGELARGFREQGVSMWKSDYDELAVLSFFDRPPQQTVERVLTLRRAMEDLRPRPDRSLTFNLASSIAFLELAGAEAGSKSLAGVKALLDMQCILNARAAAAAGAAAAAS